MLKYALAAALLAGSATTAFARIYQGTYTVSFFNDPGKTPGSQICLNLAVSNGIAGFPDSGTFADTEGDGITGQYIVDGSSMHLIMLATGFGDNVDLIGTRKGKTVAGAYDDFESGYNGGANTDVSSGTFKLTPGCSDAAQRKPPRRHTTTN